MERYKSALRSLLKSENGEDILAFLRSRGKHAHIIAPDWVRQRAGGNRSTENAASWVSGHAPDDHIPDGKSNVLVIADNAGLERAMVRAIGPNKGRKLFGLFADVLPALLCGMNGMAVGRTTEGLVRYALLCLPRSGSRYLAAVLRSRGVGAPKEHLREPLAKAIAEGGLEFPVAMASLERFGQQNGIFGTKLISTFLITAARRSISEVDANIGWMIDRGYRIVHLQRSLQDAVVSSYIAFLMHKWHFFGELDEGSQAKLDSLVFEGGAAFDEYIRFRADQILLHSVVKAHAIPSINYRDIESNIDSVLDRICDFAGIDMASLEGGRARIPVPTRSASQTYARFASELEALLEKRKHELQERTVKRVRAITGADRSVAQMLVDGAGAVSG